MLAVCRANTGAYTKAGQHISSLAYIVPRQYTETLAVLTDKAPFMAMAEVSGVLAKQLGPQWRSLFAEFEETPVAAASLAQVHRAVLADGRKVAVKVQFPAITRQLKMDVATLSLCLRVIGYLFPKFQFTWVLPEFKRYMNQEIDFEVEAANNARIKGLLAGNRQVATPDVYRELCTKRVIVMEWIDGCKMNDIAAIRGMGFHEHDVAQLLLECFADQVFLHGFLHADPHSANAFVRPVQVGRRTLPQLVLLDHGLYRELDVRFRDNYAHLWRALVLRKQDEIERYARALGAGDYYKIFSFILTFRPFAATGVLSGKVTATDIEGARREWEEMDPNISALLKGLDRELLLVLRTQTILRGINVELGGTVNRYHVNARSAIRAIHSREPRGWLAYRWELFRMELTFWAANVYLWLAQLFWPNAGGRVLRLGERT
jgi:aarF domain-containing kinase